ncbi:hypothetical protein A1O7_01594 [Cladophialophora yegresii CBS 114405]|uniref:DNA damage-responsive protein 48 n=1 Tax=Cladophialophora yegresii CBS 114405 TaxID=1182544 RepID=W9WBB4_9EURO|nr:uncharacterized protein A1O7_01594 [Cladophialophora yegresii CBS 114405]EXJ65253.1 hypothetical protein A1O7_01594 [Cladophialophora yegresii CBS 114405]
MDQLKGAFNSFSGGNNEQANKQGTTQQSSSGSGSGSGGGGFLGGLGDKFNSAAGGGRESEKNEDYLDKGIDFVQEKFLGQGPQDNESAIEQAKDEQISDFLRNQYKSATGKDVPIKDKPTKF